MNKHVGSTLESLLEETGEREDVELLVQKKLLALKIQRAMDRRNMSKAQLATAMKTSRTVVHRLLDPRDTGVTLATLMKASKALGSSVSACRERSRASASILSDSDATTRCMIFSWRVRISSGEPSKRSAQTWLPVRPSIS